MTLARRSGLTLVLVLALVTGLMAGPALADSRVEARASALFESTEADLETRLDEIAERTGVDVYIVFTESLGGATAAEFARDLPHWDRPGRQLVLLIAMAERQVRVETDAKLAADHPDAIWARLIEAHMLAALRAGRQGTATRQGLNAIEDELMGERPALLTPPRGTIDALRDTLFVLIAGLLAGLSFNRIRGERMWRARW
jgi:uncharacterized membrane protein YgcG